ncbi:AAA-ATPase [Vitis vinifera]|uniref:AAA-ATPase n=1 Tax=Vitis vinifera TaxID=29760 RepID=A0A438J481_VITVI|nr:AAA-ATPase [Vitis vinifera]
MLTLQNKHTAAKLVSAAASLAAVAILIRKITKNFMPSEVHGCFSSSQLTIIIEEFQAGVAVNKLFEAADIYLGANMAGSVRKVKVLKGRKEKKMEVTMDRNEEMTDVFENIRVKWTLVCKEAKNPNGNLDLQSEERSYELSFSKEHKGLVLNSYLPYILERSKAIKEGNKALKLHTVMSRSWQADAINIDHPMTFQTLAMDSELKKALVDDLDNFINGKDYYRRIGKAWKRDLKLLLLAMSSRSILVMEHVDCMFNILQSQEEDCSWAPRKNQVTLSGLLNFIDGVWSFCGDQGRIIIITTNHRDKLDPALLRPGRMDMHIHMSYCTVSAFKQLPSTALGSLGRADEKQRSRYLPPRPDQLPLQQNQGRWRRSCRVNGKNAVEGIKNIEFKDNRGRC